MNSELQKELDRCLKEAEVEAVHHVRTGTRRVQAMAETVVREAAEENAELRQALEKWLKSLKRLRRAAGPVRDLDVHRELLDQLVERAEKAGRKAEPTETSDVADISAAPVSALEQQAERFDVWLKHSREAQAIKLRKEIEKSKAALSEREQNFEAALAETQRSSATRLARPASAVALENFARISEENPHLDNGNLHDFRKGAKKARYVAESGGEDKSAQEVGKVLKKLQDDIGDWHDWLMMAEEARAALGEEGAELITVLDRNVVEFYSKSLKTAIRLRGKLMGEWHAQRLRKPVQVRAVAAKRTAKAG